MRGGRDGLAAKALAEHALQLIHPTLELTAFEGGPVRVVAHNYAMLRLLCQHTNGSPTTFEGQFVAARTVQMSLRGILTQCRDHSLCTRAVDSETCPFSAAASDLSRLKLITSLINIQPMPRRPTPRSIGRPRQDSDPDARERLLDAAATLFAERGIAGTTVAEIAARAGVTPAMVHYYFTNRDQLVDALAAERLLPTVTAVWSPVVETDDLVPMLRGLVRRIFKAAEINPWLPSLWLREIVSEGGQLRGRLLKKLRFDYIEHLINTVATAQRRGEIDRHIEPRLVLMSLIGNTLLPLAAGQLLHQVPLLRGIDRDDLARHAEALLVSALSTTRNP